MHPAERQTCILTCSKCFRDSMSGLQPHTIKHWQNVGMVTCRMVCLSQIHEPASPAPQSSRSQFAFTMVLQGRLATVWSPVHLSRWYSLELSLANSTTTDSLAICRGEVAAVAYNQYEASYIGHQVNTLAKIQMFCSCACRWLTSCINRYLLQSLQ